MEPAPARFFAVPELVSHLTRFLDYPGISRLMQTNRRMHALCTSAHYYNLRGCYEPRERHLFGNLESIIAVSRNVHLVRQLVLCTLEIVYYVNGIFAYQNLLAYQTRLVTPGRQEQQQPVSWSQERPPWLAPPAPHICAVLPIPPMTFLTKLELWLGLNDGWSSCPYFLPNARDPKATITQIAWIISHNPHLLDLTLGAIAIKDTRDVRVLATALSGLTVLQKLHVEALRWMWTVSVAPIGAAFFFSCPPTLRTLSLESEVQGVSWDESYSDEYRKREPGERSAWEKSDEECGLTALPPRRQEPLPLLKDLWISELSLGDISAEDLLSILAHCPNLTTLQIPSIPEIDDVQRLAQGIVNSCPHLQVLNHRRGHVPPPTFTLAYSILQALPSQQVTEFHCSTRQFIRLPDFLEDPGHLLQNHSLTLRSVTLHGCGGLTFRSLQPILVHCAGLEHLSGDWGFLKEDQQRLCIDLKGAIEFPWACTRIQCLALTIIVPHLPFHQFGADDESRFGNNVGIDTDSEDNANEDDANESSDTVDGDNENGDNEDSGNEGSDNENSIDNISVNENDNDDMDDDEMDDAIRSTPYYSRPAPTPLTSSEKQQLASLEKLYKQLGLLTHLRQLDLRAVFYNFSVSGGIIPNAYRSKSFPGLLNLPNKRTGRPGFLQCLEGLSQLELLAGSVSAETEETSVTMGMLEVAWMDRYWPAMKEARFFEIEGIKNVGNGLKEKEKMEKAKEKKLPEPFRWWREKSRREGRTLQLWER
ncbi:hypothetical protein BGW39_011121 [Mortierella sp. 14UC]|nr:hypothetical protein BGW39_011121 [Mortierella sp. 14UC]